VAQGPIPDLRSYSVSCFKGRKQDLFGNGGNSSHCKGKFRNAVCHCHVSLKAFCVCVRVILGLELRAYSHSTSPLCVCVHVCVGFFWDRISRSICPGLTSNFDPPDLCLLSSWDYRREPLALSSLRFLRLGILPQVLLVTGKLYPLFKNNKKTATSSLLDWATTDYEICFKIWNEDFFFRSTGVWTQDLVFARQAFYHLSHTFNPKWGFLSQDKTILEKLFIESKA
jgi:hypothetical protein